MGEGGDCQKTLCLLLVYIHVHVVQIVYGNHVVFFQPPQHFCQSLSEVVLKRSVVGE